MPYLSEWEPLASALKRLLDAGIGENEAKLDLCNAMADEAIQVRVVVDETERDYRRQTLNGRWVEVPPRLSPNDFDWVLSRPHHAWSTGPAPGAHYNDLSPWKRRVIALLELHRHDVDQVLLTHTTRSDSTPVVHDPQSTAEEETLHDLIDWEAAARHIPSRRLWIMTLRAIDRGMLKARFLDFVTEGKSLREVLARHLQLMEREGLSVAGLGWTRAVFLDSAEYAKWLDKAWNSRPAATHPHSPVDTSSTIVPRPKRKPHAPDYREQDRLLVEKMHEMIRSGEARNPTDAARALGKKAAGAGKESSKVTRLIQRYSDVFRTEHD